MRVFTHPFMLFISGIFLCTQPLLSDEDNENDDYDSYLSEASSIEDDDNDNDNDDNGFSLELMRIQHPDQRYEPPTIQPVRPSAPRRRELTNEPPPGLRRPEARRPESQSDASQQPPQHQIEDKILSDNELSAFSRPK